MHYFLTPYNNDRQIYCWWENAFSEEELDWLQKKAREEGTEAKIGNPTGNGVVHAEKRRSTINWMANSPETYWVFQKLGHVVSAANAKYFNFDLTGFGESLQLTNYDESFSGMYDWHVDFTNNTNQPSRKLSLVLQLSDPVDYEGGVLELQPTGSEIVKMRKQRGLIILFPSWTLHRVTEVYKGNRQSLVSWITGPNFK